MISNLSLLFCWLNKCLVRRDIGRCGCARTSPLYRCVGARCDRADTAGGPGGRPEGPKGSKHAEGSLAGITSGDFSRPLLVELSKQAQLLHACFFYPKSKFAQLFGMFADQKIGVLLSQRSGLGRVCTVSARATTNVCSLCLKPRCITT